MAQDLMNISFEEHGKYTVVVLSGKVHQQDFRRLKSVVDVIIINGTKCIVCDLENLVNITSIAVAMLVCISKLTDVFCVYGLNKHTEEVFDRLGLQHIFHVYKTKNDFLYDRRKLGLF